MVEIGPTIFFQSRLTKGLCPVCHVRCWNDLETTLLLHATSAMRVKDSQMRCKSRYKEIV